VQRRSAWTSFWRWNIKKEREARSAAEADAAALRAELATTQEKLAAADEKLAAADEKLAVAGAAQNEIDSLHREREAVKLRVESMLAKMDELL